jgi:hypothetical protein
MINSATENVYDLFKQSTNEISFLSLKTLTRLSSNQIVPHHCL